MSVPLPMVGCALEPADLAEQLACYRRLGEHVTEIEQRPGVLVVQFADDLPVGLLERTVEVERGCCSFLQIEFEESRRRLTVAIAEQDQQGVVAAIGAALGAAIAT